MCICTTWARKFPKQRKISDRSRTRFNDVYLHTNFLIMKFIIFIIVMVTMNQAHAGWYPSTYKLQSKMISVGMDRPLSEVIINECKRTAKDPKHCVVTASFISGAESTLGTNLDNCKNVFWVAGKCFTSRTEAVKDWVTRYNKYWHKQKDPNGFYSNSKSWKPKTRYCMDEDSSKSEWFCPNGHSNAWKVFLKLK